MAERYSLELKPGAVDDIRHLGMKQRRRVVARIRQLAVAPVPAEAERISGEGKYRLRMGEVRLVYGLDTGSRTVCVVKVGRRSPRASE